MGIRILIADDHRMFREALTHMINGEPDLEVVGHAGSGSELSGLVAACRPDMICMDIHMPDLNGIDATRQLMAAQPQLRIIALSAHSDMRFVRDMLAAGACAYVTKAEASDELLRAIRAAMQGTTYLCPSVAAALKSSLGSPVARTDQTLSARESQVASLVARGATSSQIADQLKIAPSTVEVHRRNIMRKLDIHGVAELTRYVLEREAPGS